MSGLPQLLRSEIITSSTKCVLVVATLVLVCVMQAQHSRKVIYRTNPVYPAVLKDKQIGGLVRIRVVVTPMLRTSPAVGEAPSVQFALEQKLYNVESLPDGLIVKAVP
jgi:hypothetical protein